MRGDKKMWSDYIRKQRQELVGKQVKYKGQIYRIALVDYNGVVHIDLPSKYNKTTAVYMPSEARENLI